jgi:hypothetical protein
MEIVIGILWRSLWQTMDNYRWGFSRLCRRPYWGQSYNDRADHRWSSSVRASLHHGGEHSHQNSKGVIHSMEGMEILTYSFSDRRQIVSIPAGQEIVPSRYRPLVSVCNVIFIVSLGVATQLAQAATVKYEVGGSLEGWRYSYYLPAIYCGISSILVFLFYRPPPTRIQRETEGKPLLKSLDFAGFFLAVAGLIIFTMGLVWGGNMFSWKSSHVIATLTVGIVTLIAFGIYELKGTSTGLLDHRMFENRNFPVLLAVAFVDGILLFGLLAFMPQEVAYA